MKLTIAKSIRNVDGAQWDVCGQGSAMLSQAFFRALEDSGMVGAGQRILPRYITLASEEGRLLGCVPAMLKVGTLAEYGPEYLWLKAGEARGVFSWPKFQAGIPLFPVLGPKLLSHPEENQERITGLLIRGLRQIAFETIGVGVLDILNIDAKTAARLAEDGWLISQEVHSLWANAAFPDYSAYLDSLPHRKRYKIRQERRKVAEQDIKIHILLGEAITPQLMDEYYDGHEKVCLRYGNRTWIPKATWLALLRAMPQSMVLAAALEGDQLIAGSLWIIDGAKLRVRTWSAHREVPGLVMELVCHRPIEFAIDHQLDCVDSGLFGQHKRERDYADYPVYSAHCFRDERLRELAILTLKDLGQYPWPSS